MPHTSQRIVPTGNCGIFFLIHGNAMYSSSHRDLSPQSYLYGQQNLSTQINFSGKVKLVAIIFQPTGAMSFFRTPASEFIHRKIAIDSLNDPQLMELEKRLIDSPDLQKSVYWIEQFLVKRFYQCDDYKTKRLSEAINLINQGKSLISELASSVCLCPKQFNRIFTESIGTSPKEFTRIIRFQKTLYQLQRYSQTTLSQLAETNGYYDKSHLIKEFKEFSAYAPHEFRAICDPYSEYHSLFRSTFIDCL